MKHLLFPMILVVISSWPVWGWAEKPDFTTKMPKSWDGGTIVYLPGTYDKDHPPQLAPKDVQCLVRMREAMQMMDTHLMTAKAAQKAKTLPRKDVAVWYQTMIDCVEGGK